MIESTAPLTPNPTDPNPDLSLNAAPKLPEHSWLVSLSFWGTLLVAAAIYGSVALSPKFCVWNRVRLEQQRNAERLTVLETEVGYLERVEQALATDPEFRRQASGANSKTDSRSELIPVSGNLLFGNQVAPIETAPQLASIPRYHVLAEQLATDRALRNSLLILTALLTFFAFAILNDAGTSLVVAGKQTLQSAVSWPFQRYRKPAEIQPVHHAEQIHAEQRAVERPDTNTEEHETQLAHPTSKQA